MSLADLVERHGADSDLGWICKYCGKEFDNERAFNIHQKEEHGDVV